jgi:hypothetical protein
MRLAVGDVFKTEQKAIQHCKKLEALAEIKHYIAENFEEWEPDWKDESEGKYHIFFDHFDNKFDWNWDNQFQGLSLLPYFKTKDEALEIINKFEEELRIIFGVRERSKR